MHLQNKRRSTFCQFKKGEASKKLVLYFIYPIISLKYSSSKILKDPHFHSASRNFPNAFISIVNEDRYQASQTSKGSSSQTTGLEEQTQKRPNDC